MDWIKRCTGKQPYNLQNADFNETVTSARLSVVCLDLKTYHMQNKLLHVESAERYKHNIQVIMV
jgi:hypothetical protein